MARVELASLPPEEAVKRFRQKGFKVGFDWRDVWQQEHGKAFTVAKAMRYDILRDIREAVDDAIAKGISLDQFRKQLEPTLRAKGWWGKALQIDPKTGEQKLVQLGSPRRLKTIYDTNLRVSLAAGKWDRIERVKKRRPYLIYRQLDRDTKREEHEQYDGLVLPVDDPTWDSIYPPNGFNCGCYVQQVSQRDLDRMGLTVSERPNLPMESYRNPRTGQVVQVPPGISPGFAYNPGKDSMRGVFPPPRGGSVPPAAGQRAERPLPPPRSAPARRLLAEGLEDQVYVNRFLKEFGATPTKPAVFTDVLGEPVMIGADLFRGADGRLKIAKRGRERGLLLLADTIKDPDEVWWHWEEFPKGRMTLLRRYVARWKVAGQELPVLALFDVGTSGWRGVTGFTAERVSYLEKQRAGTLAYRRKK